MSQVLLITGTSRGLGAHLAQALTTRGHVVYGASRQGGDDPRHLALDVTDPASCARAVDVVLHREGRLDGLINNAGAHLFGAATETSDPELRHQMELNFHGAVHMTRAVAPHLLAQRSGRIVNMSSVGGRFATPFTSAYAASKFALEGYMEALRLELLPFGVYVCNLEPAFLATGTTATSVSQVDRDDPTFAEARRLAHTRALDDGARGLPMERVSDVVHELLTARAPAFRHTVDGFATRLSWMRAITPSSLFERLVIRQTAPELLYEA